MDRIGFNPVLSEESLKTSSSFSSSPCSFSLLKSSADYLSSSWNQSLAGGWRRSSVADEDVVTSRKASQRSTSLSYTASSFLSESLGWSAENLLHQGSNEDTRQPLGGSLNQPSFLQNLGSSLNQPRAGGHQPQGAFKIEDDKQKLKNECKQVFFDCAM